MEVNKLVKNIGMLISTVSYFPTIFMVMVVKGITHTYVYIPSKTYDHFLLLMVACFIQKLRYNLVLDAYSCI